LGVLDEQTQNLEHFINEHMALDLSVAGNQSVRIRSDAEPDSLNPITWRSLMNFAKTPCNVTLGWFLRPYEGVFPITEDEHAKVERRRARFTELYTVLIWRDGSVDDAVNVSLPRSEFGYNRRIKGIADGWKTSRYISFVDTGDYVSIVVWSGTKYSACVPILKNKFLEALALLQKSKAIEGG